MDDENDDIQARTIHENKKPTPEAEEQSIAQDAQQVASSMVQQSFALKEMGGTFDVEPEDVISFWAQNGNKEWEYALRHDKPYVNRVIHLAKGIAKSMKADFEGNKGKIVPLTPAPGGDKGGAQAAARWSIKVATTPTPPRVYIHKTSGDFALKETIGCKIATGKAIFPDENGFNSSIRFESGQNTNQDVAVLRNGKVALTIAEINNQVPGVLRTFCLEATRNLPDSEDLSNDFLSSFCRIGSLAFESLSVQILGGSSLVALRLGAPEPPLVSGLRVRIGKMLHPLIDALYDALSDEAFDSGGEWGVFMLGAVTPESYPAYKEKEEKFSAPHRRQAPEPSLIRYTDEINVSVDVRSLLMTLSHYAGTDPNENEWKKMIAIAYRLIEIVSTDPKVLERRPITNDDIKIIEEKAAGAECKDPSDRGKLDINLNALKQVIAAVGMDDADILQMMLGESRFVAGVLKNLIAAQNRMHIISANPLFAFRDLGRGNDLSTNRRYMEKIPPSSPAMRTFFEHVVDVYKKADPDISVEFENYMMKSLTQYVHATTDQEVIKMMMEHGPVQDTACCLAIDFGNDEVRNLAVRRIRGTEPTDEQLLSILCNKNIMSEHPELVMRLKERPGFVDNYSNLLGERSFKNVKRIIRKSRTGGDIPTAAEITSMPEDPEVLLNDLIDIEDQEALFKLFVLMVNKFTATMGSESGLGPLISMAKTKLDALGSGTETTRFLRSRRLYMGADEVVHMGTIGPDKMAPEHFEEAMRSGDLDMAAKALKMLYMKSKETAYQAASSTPPPQRPEMFLSLLPAGIRGDPGMPAWFRRNVGTDREAIVLPDGKVVIGNNGTYRMVINGKERTFASNKADAIVNAIKAARRGR